MHKIHITPGVVLSKRAVGESNTAVLLLTRDLGLVRVFAKSARKERSKLRYGLEAFTHARFSMVKGKHEWKLTGVEKISRLTAQAGPLAAPASSRQALGRISKLLQRLVQGEEPVPELFSVVLEGFEVLSTISPKQNPVAEPTVSEDFVQGSQEAVEIVLVLRILSILGYLPQHPHLQPFINDSLFSLELTAEAARSRTLLIKAINESLGATGL